MKHLPQKFRKIQSEPKYFISSGGTETGHGSVGSRSHHNGWKIDIRKSGNDCATK